MSQLTAYRTNQFVWSSNHEQGGDWATVHDSTYARGGSGQNTNIRAEVYKGGGSYDIYRAGATFDTSSIPANATIISAVLYHYRRREYNGQMGCSLFIQKMSDIGVGTNFYNKAYFTDDVGVFNSPCNYQSELNNINAYVAIPLNVIAIVKAGITKLGFRTAHDHDNSVPGNDGNSTSISGSDWSGTQNYLLITYSIPATVANMGVSNIVNNGARLSGNVSSDGGGTVSDRGFVIDGSVTVHVGTGTGAYYADVTGFNDGSTHTFKPFAVNESGTVYGDTVSFKTLATLTTGAITKKSARKFTPTASVSSAENYTTRGFQYGLTETPTLGVSESGVFTDSAFTMEVSGLKPFTLYHYRAFVQNQTGASYGGWLTIKTDGEGGGILIL